MTTGGFGGTQRDCQALLSFEQHGLVIVRPKKGQGQYLSTSGTLSSLSILAELLYVAGSGLLLLPLVLLLSCQTGTILHWLLLLLLSRRGSKQLLTARRRRRRRSNNKNRQHPGQPVTVHYPCLRHRRQSKRAKRSSIRAVTP